MATKIFMPKLGMTMEEGTIIQWYKALGDDVKKGEPILEIETDKITMDVESDVSGTLLKILYAEGDVVPVVTTIAYIGQVGEPLPEESSSGDSFVPIQHGEDATAKGAGDADYDVIVVGAGPAGYVAAIRAAQLGGRVLCVEKSAPGGTCLNRGCIPTKAYLHSAGILRSVKEARRWGISLEGATPVVELSAVRQNKDAIVKKLTSGISGLLKSNRVAVISGDAHINGDKTVMIKGKAYKAAAVVYAGGSLPVLPPIPGADLPGVVTSAELLELEDIPKRLVIIGGGVIGVEFATVFQAFGSRVTILELADKLLPSMDGQIGEEIKKSLQKSGVELKLSAGVESIASEGDGLMVMANGMPYPADMVLMAVGRKADIGGIAEANIKTENGFVAVDAYMRTSIEGIYAAGDCTGKSMLAHAAFRMGEVAAENAMGGKACFDGRFVPACVYTEPEAASVGLSEEAAAAAGKINTGVYSMAANGRALTMGAPEGFVKVIADGDTNEILGVHMVGPGATEIISTATAMLHMEMTTDELEHILFAHPTCGEALKEASDATLGKSIHISNLLR